MTRENLLRKFSLPVCLILALFIFIAVNMLNLALFHRYKFDLTERHVYSLSEGSKNFLSTLEKPVSLKVFFSRELARGLPAVEGYALRVRGLLEQYKRYSGGKLTVAWIDPTPFSEEEDAAVSYGLQGIPVNMGGKKLYFGAVATSEGSAFQAVPFFHFERERFLEMDLSRLIYDGQQREKKRLGILTSLSMVVDPRRGNEWALLQQIRALFDVEVIDPEEENIPDEVDMLWIVQPNKMSEEMQYALDQFILSGRKALLFLDPRLGDMSHDSYDEKLVPLLNSWGVAIPRDKSVLDAKLAQPARVPTQYGQQIIGHLGQLAVPAKFMDRDHQATALLQGITLFFPGAIELLEERSTKIEPLIYSSNETMMLPSEKLVDIKDVVALMQWFEPEAKARILAAEIRGNAVSAFPGKTEEHREEGDIHLIVMSDVDMLHDAAWVESQGPQLMPFADNGALAINFLDHLSGSDALISLRGRAETYRPFTALESISREAEMKYLTKERSLQKELAETEKRLQELQQVDQASGAMISLSEEQKMELEAFREKALSVRKELRHVQLQLQQEISALASIIKALNIMLVPLVVIVLGFFMLRFRYRRKN